MLLKKFVCLLIFYSLFCNYSFSQNAQDVRSLSMGNTSVSTSYDVDALNQNPANIVFQRSKNNAGIYFNLVTNLRFQSSSKYLSLGFFDNYFAKSADGNTRPLSEQDKADILNNASNAPSNISASGKLASVVYNTKKYGSFGFSIDERFTAGFTVARDFLDIALYGNILDNEYDFSGTQINAYWTRQLNFSYAKGFIMKNKKLFDEISVGVSVKPQLGLYYIKTETTNLRIIRDQFNTIQGVGAIELVYSGLTSDNEFKYSFDNSGFGVGFDAGISAVKTLSRFVKLNVGLSVTDMGFINWTKNTFKYSYNGNFLLTDITSKQQIDSLRERIKGSRTPVPSFSEGLPMTLRFGVSFKIFDNPKKDSLKLERATISIDYSQGLTDNLGSDKKSIIGIGAEVNIGKVVSPRIGVAIGGEDDVVATFGVGIDTGPVLIDLGTYNFKSIYDPRGTSKLSAGLNIKFKVN